MAQIEAAVRSPAGPQRCRQLVDIRRDEPGSDVASHAIRRDRRRRLRVDRLGDEAGVAHRRPRRRHRQLGVATHHFRRLAVALGHELADDQLILAQHRRNLARKTAGIEPLDALDR